MPRMQPMANSADSACDQRPVHWGEDPHCDQKQPQAVQASTPAGSRYGCWKAKRRPHTRHMSQAFAVVIEETGHNFSAYVPDLPGCVATGPTRDDVLAEIRDAIAFHLEGLAADAQPQPPVRSSVATVLV